jgi:hypothetical protein
VAATKDNAVASNNQTDRSWLNDRLLACASADDLTGVMESLRLGAEVNWVSPDHPRGWTPLIAAANSGCGGVVAVLLEAGADPSLSDCRDWSATMYACRWGHVGVVSMLLAHHGRGEEGRATLDEELIFVSFPKKGPLGIVLGGSSPHKPSVVSTVPGSVASARSKLKPGLILRQVIYMYYTMGLWDVGSIEHTLTHFPIIGRREDGWRSGERGHGPTPSHPVFWYRLN